MKFSIKTLAVYLPVIAFSCTSTAGLITDTLDNSFIDETTGIEWMDFGINNNESFDYVLEQTQVGGKYEYWSVATQEQAYDMFLNAFAPQTESEFKYGDPYVEVGAEIFTYGSSFDQIMQAMGHNTTYSGDGEEVNFSFGLFFGENGLGKLELQNYAFGGENKDWAYFDVRTNQNEETSVSKIWRSTLLVKNAVEVPEPSSLAIFALGILGFSVRKAIKNN
jgi:hypothetical protein